MPCLIESQFVSSWKYSTAAQSFVDFQLCSPTSGPQNICQSIILLAEWREAQGLSKIIPQRLDTCNIFLMRNNSVNDSHLIKLQVDILKIYRGSGLLKPALDTPALDEVHQNTESMLLCNAPQTQCQLQLSNQKHGGNLHQIYNIEKLTNKKCTEIWLQSYC